MTFMKTESKSPSKNHEVLHAELNIHIWYLVQGLASVSPALFSRRCNLSSIVIHNKSIQPICNCVANIDHKEFGTTNSNSFIRIHTFYDFITSRRKCVRKIIGNILHCTFQATTRNTIKSKYIE